MNKILFILLAGLTGFFSCSPSDEKCKAFTCISVDGKTWLTESDRIDHDAALMRINALVLEGMVIEGTYTQIQADTAELGYNQRIAQYNAQKDSQARACGCK